ncbi:MAG: helical backbone metal receptor [Gemmatimonadota bacterium]
MLGRIPRRRPRALTLPLIAALMAACGGPDAPSSAAPIQVTDDAGRTVRLQAPAARVLSLIPAQTEAVRTLAGPGALVARTRWDTDPALAHLPVTQDALTPSVEWIVAQAPDLVIAWADADARSVVGRLEAVGIPVYAARVETLAEVDATLRRLGLLLGRQARADSLRAAIAADHAAVREAVAGREVPSVLYVVGTAPPTVAGPGTYVDELITLAGGRNVFHDARRPWPQVGMEAVVARAPDVVLIVRDRPPADPAAALAALPGWRALGAVREGRVVALDADVFNRPGVRVGEAARLLAEALHPGALAGGLP